MKIRIAVASLIGAFAFLISAQPAAAQGKPEFSIGYNFLRLLDDGGENVPAGWGASVAAGKNEHLKIVGDITGNYKDGAKVHMFQGGVEFNHKHGNAVPFFRILAGVGVFSGEGDSDSVFAITPEGGVKFMGKGRVGARVAIGFPILRDNGETAKTMRLFIGATIAGK